MNVMVVQPGKDLTASGVQQFFSGVPAQPGRDLLDLFSPDADVGDAVAADKAVGDQRCRNHAPASMSPSYARPVSIGHLRLLGISEALALFDGWAQGVRATERDELIVVDLDGGFESDRLRLPAGLPNVVLGVGSPRPSRMEAGVDVAVTTARNAPRPWVTVRDLDDTIEALSSRTTASPMASAMYVQVLRGGAGLDVDEGLLLESLAYSTLQGGPEFRSWLAARPPVTASPSPDPVLVSRDGNRLFVVLNRPKVHNAYDAAVREALCDALAIALADAGVEEVVLSGVGPSFCSGGDLAEFGTARDPASAHLLRFSRSPGWLITRLGERVLARVHGFCVGSGIEIPAFAPRIHARPDTVFGLPELGMGLIPGAGGTVSLPRRIGRHRTAWLGLAGQRIDADMALEWGLVDEIVDL